MIPNTRAMFKLNRAVDVIISPTSESSIIQESETILKELRTLPQYSLLLSQFLTNTRNTCMQGDNKIKFVLLQLRKVTPIYNDFIWWNIVEFYYSCRQKMVDLVIEVIRQQTQQNLECEQNSQPDYSFVEFFKNRLKSDDIGFSHISRMLCLGFRILEVFRTKFLKGLRSEIQKRKWVKQCEFLLEFISILFQKTNRQSQNFTEQMVTIIIYLSSLLEKAGHDKMHMVMTNQFLRLAADGEWENFATPFSMFLILGTQKANNMQVQTIPRQIFGRMMQDLLRQYDSSCNRLMVELKNQLIVQRLKQSDNQLMCQYWQVIIREFYTHLIKLAQRGQRQWMNIINYVVEFDPHFSQRLNFPNNQHHYEQLDLSQAEEEESLIHNKYFILMQCIQIMSHRLQLLLQKQSEVSVITVAALAFPHFDPWPSSCQTIVSYLHQCLHHNTSKPEPNLFYCLLYAWRFFPKNPAFSQVLNFFYSLLDIRLAFPSLQNICDQILGTLVPCILTCIETSEIINLAQIMISNAEKNEMDRTAQTYLPILLILENTESLWDLIEDERTLVKLFSCIIDHLIEEQNSQNFYPTEFSNFDIFYKFASLLVRYLADRFYSQTSMVERQTIENEERLSILQILNLTQKFTFRNALYTPQTGLLYVYYLIQSPLGRQNSIGLIENMMDFSFWTRLDIEDCIFYATIVIRLGIELNNQNPQNYSFGYIWSKVSSYLIYILDDLLSDEKRQQKIGILEKFLRKVRECEKVLGYDVPQNSPFMAFKKQMRQKSMEIDYELDFLQ